MTTRYICTGGCNGISDTPGTCQAPTCAKHGQPLTEVHVEESALNVCTDCGTLCKATGPGCAIEAQKSELN